ncbi:MAG: glycosyltransferase, partial [Vicinamibacteria bacterium]
MPDRQREQTQAIVLALLTLLFHVLTAKGYGYFRDELYYVACSEHLAFGYVDHPPLIALVTWLSRVVFGDSLYALRLFPAVCAAGTVYLTASITRDLGGGR